MALVSVDVFNYDFGITPLEYEDSVLSRRFYSIKSAR